MRVARDENTLDVRHSRTDLRHMNKVLAAHIHHSRSVCAKTAKA